MAVTIKINPCPERYNSANPYKTGQTTSYATKLVLNPLTVIITKR